MAVALAADERLVQVGVTAMRAADGSFLPAQPMYIIVKADEIDERIGMAASEADPCQRFGEAIRSMYMESLQKHGGIMTQEAEEKIRQMAEEHQAAMEDER